jgi:hypothetical protein
MALGFLKPSPRHSMPPMRYNTSALSTLRPHSVAPSGHLAVVRSDVAEIIGPSSPMDMLAATENEPKDRRYNHNPQIRGLDSPVDT